MGLLKWLTGHRDEESEVSTPTLEEQVREMGEADGRAAAERAAQRLAASGLEPSETLRNAMMLQSLSEALAQRFPDLSEEEIEAYVERAKNQYNL